MTISCVESSQNIPQNPTTSQPSDDASLTSDDAKKLFNEAMNRQWGQVVKLYSDERIQGQHINSANETLLHVAISGATEKVVLYLLKIVNTNREMCKILSLKNNTGDTPLHLAAALGLKKVCRRITKMCPDMVTSARNNLQETPLFSAVRHGKKETFFVLEFAIHKIQKLTIDEGCLSRRDTTHCRRHDGNNILHYAIIGEQFDLAYEIISLYPQLACMNYVNSSGETALHTLANMPSVFKSGARFGLYDTILYYCTFTAPLKFQFIEKHNFELEEISDIPKDENDRVLPPIYNVCVDLFSFISRCIYIPVDIAASVLKICIRKACRINEDEENPFGAQKEDEDMMPSKIQKRRCPPNYDTMISFFKIIVKLLLFVIGIGSRRVRTVARLKQKHRNALTIMEELVDRSTLWDYEEANGGKKPVGGISRLSFDIGSKPPPMITSVETGLHEKTPLNSSEESPVLVAAMNGITEMVKRIQRILEMYPVEVMAKDPHISMLQNGPSESPVLVAAKNGITEMVKRILEKYPVAVMDKDKDKKNIVLLAVEHRQVHVYMFILGVQTVESVFRKVDKDDNSALHLAAKLSHSRPWSTGAALQMQWEYTWYKYVRSTMNLEILSTINKDGKRPEEVFAESHDTLIKDGISWLTSISQSCSTVAALFATVAFASVSTVPGGLDQQSGFPILGNRPTFQTFAISSLVALCFSVTSIVMFLAILTSSFKVRDFESGLPIKLILGLTSLFIAIASTLVSFCVGDFFLVAENLKFSVYPIYGVMCLAVTFFAVAHYPLYINLIKLTIMKILELMR